MSGKLLAVPYDPFHGDPGRWERLVEFVADHPGWFSIPGTREQLQLSVGATLADPRNIILEVYRGAEFIGVISFTRIVPLVDAQVHFVFMDGQNLKGKRDLLLNVLDLAYTEFGFNRLTFEIPEPFGVLVRFVRRYLGFTYEGETAILGESLPGGLSPWTGWQTWASRVGSRRERAHWHDGDWKDLLVLRQTADEFTAFRAKTREVPSGG